MMEAIRSGLCCIINEIDSGNSDVDDESERRIMRYINCITRTDSPISKYQACAYLNISRAKFDRLVKEGRLPSGRKLVGFKEKVWYKRDLLRKNNIRNGNNS